MCSYICAYTCTYIYDWGMCWYTYTYIHVHVHVHIMQTYLISKCLLCVYVCVMYHGHGHGHGIFILATHPEGTMMNNQSQTLYVCCVHGTHFALKCNQTSYAYLPVVHTMCSLRQFLICMYYMYACIQRLI